MTAKLNVIYSELAEITPIYCSGVASVHLDHGNLHIAYYREEITGDGILQRVIVFRIILPEKALSEARGLVDFEITARKLGSGKDGAA